MDKEYNFQILLPNGTTVRLKFYNPEPKMPFRDFIQRVEKEYVRAWKQSGSVKRKREVNWKGGSFLLVDADDMKIQNVVNFKNFKQQECHILRLQDGLEDITTTFENMWDLTPDTDLIKELPQEYTFETALADLIDNSLQAVWSSEVSYKHISVDIDDDMISIFDTGPGMDGSNENSIVKWGKMGASLHRSYKEQAIGVKPPYLKPFFGMFGYGGPIASMQLGRCALVSSKKKDSKKVYTLSLDRDALLSSNWKTGGSMRDPEEDEMRRTPHGSFTKVEISEPKSKVDVHQLRCKLKDIYFPYIQYDEDAKSGKTQMPVKFEVNGVNLTEIAGGEIATTNVHSCNGPEFVLQLQFSCKQDNMRKHRSPNLKTYRKANARLKCVYFPIEKGKENIDKIVEKLGTRENFETFSRVSIRRLGRLLPDARWGLLPFMDMKQKRGTLAQLLKRCCMRVKCFIETDAGFNPTRSKTDLAQHCPFTTALRNFGDKPLENENDIKVQIYKDGNLLNPLQLKKEYEDWLIQMHRYDDDEADCGEDQPVFVVSPANKKALRISSEVARVHKSIMRNGRTWSCGQRIKILKGACAGVHNNNVYATIEYFLLEGLQDESGGEARILCRPSSLPDEKGCLLSVNNGETNLDMGGSLSIPLSVIDAGKCIAVDKTEWDIHIEKRRQKSPSTIELLGAEQCQELEVNGALVDARAGKSPPEEVVAIVRPGNYVSSSSSKSLDQKYIVKSNLEMTMKVNFKGDADERPNVSHIYSERVGPKSLKGIQGLYVFSVKHKLNGFYRSAGVYTFSFHLNESDCKSSERSVQIKPSSKVGKWVLLNDDQLTLHRVRVGSVFPPLSIACLDEFGNRIRFATVKVAVKVQTNEGLLLFHVEKFTPEFSEHTLTVKDMLMESSELDKLRPTYGATLVVCRSDDKFSVSVPCEVNPGPLWNVMASPIFENQVLPGYTIQEFILEMFDQYGNHVIEGTQVQLNVEGLSIQDRLGTARTVDRHGCIDLGGLLKVTAGYEKSVSISIYSGNNVLLNLQSQTEKRMLRIATKVPDACVAGTQLENLVFEVVNSDGVVDATIHHEEKSGQLHMLTIKDDSSFMEESLRFTFNHGRCTVPTIFVPEVEESFNFVAAHSCYPELHLNIKVPVVQALKEKYDHLLTEEEKHDGSPTPWEVSPLQEFLQPVGNLMVPKVDQQEFQSPCNRPCSYGNTSLLPDSSGLQQLVNLKEQLVYSKNTMDKHGTRIGDMEKKLETLKEMKEKATQELYKLQGCIGSYKKHLINHIESMPHTAAAIICALSREVSFEESSNHFMGDVIGLVALLGTVCTSNLSRILAEYLGKDQMLAIVCKSFEAAGALEKFVQSDHKEVDSMYPFCNPALLQKNPTHGRSFVICLEDIRPYTGELDLSDPQRKLALPDPVLPSGMVPDGFLGYAVNMVDLDCHHLQMLTSAGHGLRETVLYCLFGQLQVYKTREDMVAARASIKHGAVSLDGGIMKQNGLTSFGVGDIEICFPVAESRELSTSINAVEVEMQIEEKKSTLTDINRCIQTVHKFHRKAKKKFEKAKKLGHKLLEDIRSSQEQSPSPKKEGRQLVNTSSSQSS
ncbi:structural maintenance of chromosomes flexible hinge domain-containing protein GMI1 [Argentina anserina]|uniref:structural maintenance of chromosomes flexible hinge domain-containing protein GMI1 n=1 Tax=Argentina anserina TaxID=57926 RepID=UPI002176745B|nr:structural maintenance of chromosomes flexible hinge domain-containing protein GMI1 [Potentilla anserina]